MSKMKKLTVAAGWAVTALVADQIVLSGDKDQYGSLQVKSVSKAN